jgi:hypothetical protein
MFVLLPTAHAKFADRNSASSCEPGPVVAEHPVADR